MTGKRQADSEKKRRRKNTRPTIGFLAGNVYTRVSLYPITIWTGVADAARKQDANLISFAGGGLSVSSPDERNVLYDLVASDNVDGLVISGGQLGLFVPVEEVKDFYDRYRHLPLVSIAAAIEGVPSVLVDNVTGLRDAINHLIEAHGHRRIAFIRGPEGHEEAEARYGAYTEALAAHGLDLNPDLVAPGHFDHEAGAAAMRLLLDERKLQPGVDFEAVVASSDRAALGALDALQARGIQVPYDVAVVGFDDVAEARVSTPSLTTVRQPIHEQGKRAVEMILALLAGEDVPEQVILPTEMVVRQSCGCQAQAVLQAAAEPAAVLGDSGETFEKVLAARREEIVDAMVQVVAGVAAEAASATAEWAEQLLDGFAAAMGDESPDGFLVALDRVLRQIASASGDAAIERLVVWQRAISALRGQILPWLGDDKELSRAEKLGQQAHRFIVEAVQQAQQYRQLQVEQQTGVLQEIGQAMMVTPDVEALMEVVARDLPRLGIPSTYLALYEGQEMPAQESRLIMAYDKNERVELAAGGQRFPSRALVPEGLLSRDRGYQMVVEALHFKDNQLGFVLLETGPRDGAVYEVLQGQISSALQSALLIEKRKQVEQELAQERDLLQALMDTSTDVIYFKDIESRFIRISKAHAKIFDLDDPKEAFGKTDFDFFGVEHAQQTYEDEQRIIKTGQPIIGLEEKETWPDGRVTWASTTKMPLRDTSGKILGTFGISRDITEQKNTAQAIAKRATELQTVAEVSTAALTSLDTTELLQKVVDLTRSSFDLYHAHIYLLDDITNELVLTAGAGKVGQKMVAQGWSIPIDRKQSLVARAARTRSGVIVNNVHKEPGWLPNEDLPQTRSELAVPLLVGDRVLGVLDVQSDESDHFAEDDVRVQTTLAAQVAVALENARLFEQAEHADHLLRERVKELDCLNDIGREMEENPPPLPELLEWITQRIPAALQYPELAMVAIEFEGKVYGNPEAIKLPRQIVHGLYISNETKGRIYISCIEDRDFIDEESALLGGIATRVSGFIENQRLLEQVNQRAVELEQSASFLDSIIDNIPVTLFVKDAKDLSFVRWNKAGEELLGFKNEEMMGKNDYDFFPKEEAEHFIRKDREVFAGGVEIEIPEEPMETKYKGSRLLHTRKIPVYGPDGTPRYLMGISEDITDRKQAEAEREQLLDDVQRLAAIVENHPDFIGVGTLKGKPLYLNPAGLKMMGLPLEYDITTMDAGDFFTPEDAEKLMKEGIPTALEQGFWSIEANLLRADGKTVPVEETISINYDTDGNPTSFSITMHDITNRQVAATEQSRLLAEVEASYRQYVQQEWAQYLQEQHHGQWHIEHKQHETFAASDLTWLQEEVIREQATKVISRRSGNGPDWPTQDTGSESPAAIVSPISLRGQVIGTLNLQDIAPDRNWSDEEIALVEAVSEQLALTVENLRLFDDTQRRATREQVTRQITEKMHAAGDVDAIIQTGLTELAQALNVSRTYVKLSTADEQD